MGKLLNTRDEYPREALAIHVGRSVDADQTVIVPDGLALER